MSEKKIKLARKKQMEKVTETPTIRPFRQVPHWEPDAKIFLTGTEFSTLQDFFNIFAEPIQIMQDIFGRSLKDGTITVKYVDNENKEVPKEEVQAYLQQMKEYFENHAEKYESSAESAETEAN